MPTALDESKFLFEWDLQDIDLSQAMVDSPEFSFKDNMFNLSLEKTEGTTNYGCFLESVEILSESGRIHYRFDLLKRLDNTVTISRQCRCDMKELHEGWGKGDWVDPATIQDHILKVTMWTSEYNLEFDLEKINITKSSIFVPFLFIGDNKLRVLLKENGEGAKYDCLLKDVDSEISSKVRFQVDPTSVISLSTIRMLRKVLRIGLMLRSCPQGESVDIQPILRFRREASRI
jgi:hypothetical protein